MELMIQTRGVVFLGTVQFIKETYGHEAHERVLAAVPLRHQSPFLVLLRDAAWRPLSDLAVYAATAQRLLAPDDAAFFHSLGRFTGRYERLHGGFESMVASPETAMRMASKVWRSLYDVGRMEYVATGEREGVIRIHDFRATRELCQANCGAIEGLCSNDEVLASVEETVCCLDGHPCCELRMRWGPRV